MSDVLVDGTMNGAVLSDPEITVVLECLARHAGNRAITLEDLDEMGIELGEPTLKYWAQKKYAERYRKARTKLAEQLKEILADAHHSAAGTALTLESEAVSLIREKMPEMTAKELVAVMGKSSIASGIHTEKGQLLDGEATQRVERTPTEIARSLANKGIRVSYDFDGDAEEEEEDVTDAETVDDDQAQLPEGD